MKTMTDDTTSKLSELLMQGTNMGIIEGRRLLNENQDASHDVLNILNDFVVMQEDSVETLKDIVGGCLTIEVSSPINSKIITMIHDTTRIPIIILNLSFISYSNRIITYLT